MVGWAVVLVFRVTPVSLQEKVKTSKVSNPNKASVFMVKLFYCKSKTTKVFFKIG
jgi:hypothetical protein